MLNQRYFNVRLRPSLPVWTGDVLYTPCRSIGNLLVNTWTNRRRDCPAVWNRKVVNDHWKSNQLQPFGFVRQSIHQCIDSTSPLGTRRCCDVESTSLTLIQRRSNAVCPVGWWMVNWVVCYRFVADNSTEVLQRSNCHWIQCVWRWL